MDTRTGPLVQKLVAGLQEDLTEAISFLAKGRELIGALEGETRGVNGLSSFLKSQGDALDEMVRKMEEESQEVEKKMLGSTRPEIVSTVNQEKVDEVRAARGVES